MSGPDDLGIDSHPSYTPREFAMVKAAFWLARELREITGDPRYTAEMLMEAVSRGLDSLRLEVESGILPAALASSVCSGTTPNGCASHG